MVERLFGERGTNRYPTDRQPLPKPWLRQP
jgi:hypothetical protein